MDFQFQTNPSSSPNDNQSTKRKHPRMTIVCYQQSNYRIIHHLQLLLLALPQIGHHLPYSLHIPYPQFPHGRHICMCMTP